MRGEERRQRAMLVVIDPEQRIPKGHPLRRIKELADATLVQLSPTFDAIYSALGRPSIPPERLLKASLLMALYTLRSERLLCEQLDYNFLFRWFLDMEVDEAGFDHSTFSRNANGCWRTTLRAGSSPAWSRRPAPCACSRMSTSRWTAPWSRRGPRLKASDARMLGRRRRPTTRATRR